MKQTINKVNGKGKNSGAIRKIWAATVIGLCLLAGPAGPPHPARAAETDQGGRPEISFYHWRTAYDPGPESLSRLAELKSRRLYLRFFEVTLNDEGQPVPQATAVFRQKPNLPVVPVIFLENSVFRSKPEAGELAGKLRKRVLDMAEVNGLDLVPELHLDCDWTPSTKAAFFDFVKALRNQLPPGWELAATLRLDQFKNHGQTGVPPAHRGVLMAYNMGDIKRPGPGNSIIDPKVARNYLSGKSSYPLPLDLALPLFSWVVVFDDHDQYRGLLSPVPAQLSSPDHCRPLGGEMYAVVNPFPGPGGWRVPKGWRLRREASALPDLLAVPEMHRSTPKVINKLNFYHLKEILLKERSKEELETIAIRLRSSPKR